MPAAMSAPHTLTPSHLPPPQLSTLPLSIASKLVQMRELHRLKQRGDVSLSSWSLATYCCAGTTDTGYAFAKAVVFVFAREQSHLTMAEKAQLSRMPHTSLYTLTHPCIHSYARSPLDTLQPGSLQWQLKSETHKVTTERSKVLHVQNMVPGSSLICPDTCSLVAVVVQLGYPSLPPPHACSVCQLLGSGGAQLCRGAPMPRLQQQQWQQQQAELSVTALCINFVHVIHCFVHKT